MLGDYLGIVIKELESNEIFEIEEEIRSASKTRRTRDKNAWKNLSSIVASLNSKTSRAIASAFALYLDLVNLAEDNDRVRTMIKEEQDYYPDPVKGSIGEALSVIKKNGITGKEMENLLNNLSIELVLTAHPTEAKRRTILSKLQRIAEILTGLQSYDFNSSRLKNI